MASEKLGMVPHQQIQSGLSPHQQLVFPEAFACDAQPLRRHPSATGDPGTKAATRELTVGFLENQHYFPPQAQQQPPQTSQFLRQWNVNSRSSGGNASEDDDVEDESDGDEDDEEEKEEAENNLTNTVTVAKIGDSDRNERFCANSNSQKLKPVSALGDLNEIKEGNMAQSANENNNGYIRTEVRNAGGGERNYTQYLNGAEGPSSSSRQKDIFVEGGCGFSGRKEGLYPSESGDSLRSILSDPITGMLMEDAMILPCGHSFGTDGIQQIVKMKACYTCSQLVLEESIAPNLSLRLAVQAFRREEELQVHHTSKRRRERYEQERGAFCDSMLIDHPRGRGVQFPFAVRDRVIIKGNKRTPPRFVGREAIVTAQCLNGWYVVKTLDNAESVKLQYRSLEKVAENTPSRSSPINTTPQWL